MIHLLWAPAWKEVRRCWTFTPQPDTPSGRKMGTSRMWWRGIPRLTAQSLALLHPSGQGWLPSCTSLPEPHWLWPPSLIASTTHSQNASLTVSHLIFPPTRFSLNGVRLEMWFREWKSMEWSVKREAQILVIHNNYNLPSSFAALRCWLPSEKICFKHNFL